MGGLQLSFLLLVTTGVLATPTINKHYDDAIMPHANTGKELGDAFMDQLRHKLTLEANQFDNPLHEAKYPNVRVFLKSLVHEASTRVSFDMILNLLHLLGITNDEIIQWFDKVGDGVENILSQLPPKEVMLVELAAGDLLAMLQSGEMDQDRLRTDLQVIYDIMWPYVDDSVKPNIERFIKILLWILGVSPELAHVSFSYGYVQSAK